MKVSYWNAKKSKKEKEPAPLEEEMVIMQGPPDLGMSTGVEVDENKIYFYCPIGEREVLELNKTLKKLDQEMQFLSLRLNIPAPPIELRIHSEGGSAFAGLAAYDCIKSCKTPIHTYIDGCAASAATLLFVAGDRRFVSRNSFMLIHQLSASVVGGKYEEFRDELKNQEKLMHNVRQIYLETCKLSEEKVIDLMKHDLWLDADTVLEYGLADELA
jgi:ATP-dependent protease ClpP protease subunit